MQQSPAVTSQTVLDRFTADTLRSLSPQLRKAARYVVEHPGEVATRSQRHVARTAKLSAPTFTRLEHAIGYDSYDELRDLCRAEVMQPRTSLAEKAQTLVESIRLDQGEFCDHSRSALTSAFAISISFLMSAVRATLAGFPAAIMAWYFLARSGLWRAATRAGM